MDCCITNNIHFKFSYYFNTQIYSSMEAPKESSPEKEEQHREDKAYIKSKKKWKDFKLH